MKNCSADTRRNLPRFGEIVELLTELVDHAARRMRRDEV